MTNKRLDKLIKRFNLRVISVPAYIDGRAMKRPDIRSVHHHKNFVLTIPRRCYYMKGDLNKDLGKRPQLSYLICKRMLMEKRYGL